MPRLFLEGGANLQEGKTKVIKKIIKTVKNPSLLMLQWTSNDKKKNAKYRKLLSRYFKSIGVKEIQFVDYTNTRKDVLEKIKNSNLIYLPGGKTELLYQNIIKTNVVKNLKNFNGTIFGGSAGALIQCKKYVAIKKPVADRRTTKTRPGIGLTNIIVSVHYGSKNPMLSGENPEIELKNFSKKIKRKIYAIPEKSAIECNGDKLKFHGKIYTFNKGVKTKI